VSVDQSWFKARAVPVFRFDLCKMFSCLRIPPGIRIPQVEERTVKLCAKRIMNVSLIIRVVSDRRVLHTLVGVSSPFSVGPSCNSVHGDRLICVRFRCYFS
jgi:hypothetical protein